MSKIISAHQASRLSRSVIATLLFFNFIGSIIFKYKDDIIRIDETNNSIFLNNVWLLENFFKAQLLYFIYKFLLLK